MRLKEIRKENNLTQKEMSNILKVDRTVISKWESEKVIIPIEKLNDYSCYFDVSIDYLSGLSNEKKKCYLNDKLDIEIIHEKLKEVRENITLKEFEKITGFSRSAISAYENSTLIQTDFALKLCQIYNLSLDWLLGKRW